jgi:hypothetical protein
MKRILIIIALLAALVLTNLDKIQSLFQSSMVYWK